MEKEGGQRQSFWIACWANIVGCLFGVFGAFLGCTNVHFCTHPISQLRNFLLDEKVPVLGLHRGLGQQHAIVQKLYLYHWHL